MQEGLVITAVGKDRPGIVDRISGAIYEHGCNLEDSRMSILGGHFALMLLATGAPEALAKMETALRALTDKLELRCHIHETVAARKEADQNGINVASMETRVSLAPTTGTPVFSLTIDAQVPTELPVTEVRELLDQLARQENLDLDIRVVP
jgi:glycine cleavage system transcriptional repressor